METKVIAKVNNVYLLASKDEEYLIVDNLCEAIGVDLQSHLNKVKENTLLESMLELGTIATPEGKEIEIVRIKTRDAFGWIFLFEDVEKENNEVILNNIRKFHKAISEYAILRKERIGKLLEKEIRLLSEKLALQEKRIAIENEIHGKESEIEDVKIEIYDIQNAILEY